MAIARQFIAKNGGITISISVVARAQRPPPPVPRQPHHRPPPYRLRILEDVFGDNALEPADRNAECIDSPPDLS